MYVSGFFSGGLINWVVYMYGFNFIYLWLCFVLFKKYGTWFLVVAMSIASNVIVLLFICLCVYGYVKSSLLIIMDGFVRLSMHNNKLVIVGWMHG